MDIYEAIKYMRLKSEQGDTFSVSFMTYSYERDKSEGVAKIEHAKILKSSTTEHNRFADYMINLRDVDTNERKSCWILLLLEVDGQDVELT